MACSKYTLTNTGTSISNFSYRRCDDNMWEYQVELEPSQTKNIWLIDNTYFTAFSNVIVKVDDGEFPPLNATATPTPTPTPTPTITPSVSSTVGTTPTPSVTTTHTPTNTQTPTTTTTQTQTGTPNVTPTTTTTQTQTGTPNVTPTQTQTQTPTNTQSGTPDVTPTPTPTPFGTNTFKVHFYSGSTGVTLNDLILTEIPYVETSGVGFTGTTGTYPLAWSGGTNYGTHSGLSGVTVSFEITSTGGGGNSVTINYYKNNSFIQQTSQGCYAGSNTLNFYIGGAANASPSDTVEFYIS